jgi:hypothetical protein
MRRIGNDFQGICYASFGELYQYLPGGPEEDFRIKSSELTCILKASNPIVVTGFDFFNF